MLAMDYVQILEIITYIGILPAILISFMVFFFKKERKRDEQMAVKEDMLRKEMQASNDTFRRLVDSHLVEGVRREELMRGESEKRENIIRQEAEKREAMLMRTIDGFSDSMEKLSDTMGEMSKTLVQIDFRLTSMEKRQ